MNQHLLARPHACARCIAFVLLLAALDSAPLNGQVRDSTLPGRVQAAALPGNELLRALRARQATAAARVAAAGRGAPASLDLDVEEVPDGINVPDAGSVRLGLRRELLPGGVAAAERTLAQVDVDDATRLIAAGERWVAAQVELALLTAAGEQRIARRLAAEDSLLAAADDALRVRFATGAARYVDVLRVRTERLRVQSDHLAATSRARTARQRVNMLIGTVASDAAVVALIDSAVSHVGLRLGDSLPAVPPLDSLVQLAPAVGRAELAVGRAEATLALVRAGQRPALAAGVGIQRFARETGGHTVGPTLGVSMTLPFSTGTGRRLALEAAVLAVDQAVAGRTAAVASVRAELAGRSEAYRASRDQLRLYDGAALRGAREEREAALAAYRSGELPLIELLDFERALRQSEIALLRTQLDLATMRIRLLTAIDDTPDTGVID